MIIENVTICHDGDSISFETAIKSNLLILISESSFRIVKNRYGGIGENIPISLLPAILKNPNGELRQEYTWNVKY